MRLDQRLFGCQALLGRCFPSYMLPLVEYCPAAWGSTAESDPRFLDRVVLILLVIWVIGARSLPLVYDTLQ